MDWFYGYLVVGAFNVAQLAHSRVKCGQWAQARTDRDVASLSVVEVFFWMFGWPFQLLFLICRLIGGACGWVASLMFNGRPKPRRAQPRG